MERLFCSNHSDAYFSMGGMLLAGSVFLLIQLTFSFAMQLALLFFLTGLTLFGIGIVKEIRSRGLLYFLPWMKESLFEKSLLDIIYTPMLKDAPLGDLFVLLNMPLSKEERTVVLNRLPPFLHRIFTTKGLFHILPSFVQKCLVPSNIESIEASRTALVLEEKCGGSKIEVNEEKQLEEMSFSSSGIECSDSATVVLPMLSLYKPTSYPLTLVDSLMDFALARFDTVWLQLYFAVTAAVEDLKQLIDLLSFSGLICVAILASKRRYKEASFLMTCVTIYLYRKEWVQKKEKLVGMRVPTDQKDLAGEVVSVSDDSISIALRAMKDVAVSSKFFVYFAKFLDDLTRWLRRRFPWTNIGYSMKRKIERSVEIAMITSPILLFLLYWIKHKNVL